MNPVSRRASKTSKKKSAQSVRPRRGEMPGKGSTGSRHSAEADEGAETTIFVRVKQRLKDLIPDYGSDKEVISKLLEHFERLPEGERRAITERGQTLERVGELLAEESWANHYFAREHWAAAARSYCRLASSLTLSEHHRGFALYRLAYTTHEIAKKLRVTALKKRAVSAPDADHFFTKCRDWLDRSTHLFQEAASRNVGFPAHYSLACCYSTVAQVVVETRLNEKYADALSKAPAAVGDVKFDQSVWKSDIGPNWQDAVVGDRTVREKYFSVPFNPGDAVQPAEKAMRALKRTSSPPSSERLQPDTDFFRRYAQNDADLLFLNADKHVQIEFGKWLSERGNEDSEQLEISKILDADYMFLLRALPDESARLKTRGDKEPGSD